MPAPVNSTYSKCYCFLYKNTKYKSCKFFISSYGKYINSCTLYSIILYITYYIIIIGYIVHYTIILYMRRQMMSPSQCTLTRSVAHYIRFCNYWQFMIRVEICMHCQYTFTKLKHLFIFSAEAHTENE